VKIQLSILASACALVYPLVGQAQTAHGDAELDQVVVTATRLETLDVDATYASEVHTRKEIERSGATTLYDYLARQTSLQMTPQYGNRFSPQINMRGYGATNGHQNVVISVDGRRLNNIDMGPQLLGSIPLADVDRIEITKGSGSVMFGDGATAGTIQIYTKPRDGGSIEVFGGNNGTQGGTARVGMVRELLSLSATVDHNQTDGMSDEDSSGHSDESTSDTWRVGLTGKPVDGLTLKLDAGSSRIDTRYPGSLTLAQYSNDPEMNNGSTYTHQKLESDVWSIGAEYELSRNWSLSASHSDEDKGSRFIVSGWQSDYRYRSDEIAVQYRDERFSLTSGVQMFDGSRSQTDSDTFKRNLGWFIQSQYEFSRFTISAGVRTENVEYEYKPVSGYRLKDDEYLSSWDLGVNYRIDEALSVFGNYNDSFQSPDIDRFFTTNWSTGVTSFNGFISPAKVKTLTLGFNHVTPSNRLKVSVFHANLNDEIYLDPYSYTNTNIDRSHKYGLELQDTWQISPELTGMLNYSWTRAIIDREDSGGGAFDGKELPGVPKHSAVVGLNVKVSEQGNLHLSHTWRSKTWAAGDFDNNNSQKQREYQTTDVSYTHRLMKDVELYAGVNNVFDRKNGIWVGDDGIYPIDFERTWKLGARVSF
jgi:iron complex outermembrane receptor protein